MAGVVPAGRRSPLPVIARIVLAALVLLPGVAGLAAILLMAGTWIIQGFQYEVSDRMMVPPILFAAQICFMFSIVSLGIILRYARWRKAPAASLWLAAISCPVIAASSFLLVDSLGPDGISDAAGAILVTGIALMVTSLPPFLHWRRAPKSPATPAN